VIFLDNRNWCEETHCGGWEDTNGGEGGGGADGESVDTRSGAGIDIERSGWGVRETKLRSEEVEIQECHGTILYHVGPK